MALDPRVSLLMWFLERSGQTFRPDISVAAMRAGYARMNERLGLKVDGGVDVRELSIPTNDGSSIGARLYRPDSAGDGLAPVLVYFHGGGYVIGDVASYDGLARFLAREGRIAVLSVDYHLGPEHPFPQAHEDAFSALAWIQGHALSLGLDGDRIAVGGDSAGGGLAATLSSYAESRGLARPAFALLIYPAVDATGRFPSRIHYSGRYPLTPQSISWFSKKFIVTPADVNSPLLVPLDAPNPERHPPAYVLAAQYDPLVDEGRAYAHRLRDAGVSVTYDLRQTLPHGFVNMAGMLPEGKRALVAGIRATAAALGVWRVAALTGAGSGIGRALAIELSNRGYALALADVNEIGLTETAKLLDRRTKITTHVVDVSKKAAVDAFAADVVREHGRVDVLINNAGVALAGEFAQLTVEEMEWLMNINFWGTVYGVKAFLPALQRVGDATIVNLSSVFGIVGPPGQAAYAASKFAVRGFSESLREELRHSGVRVLTVHPGGVNTNIARNSRIAAAADKARELRRAEKFHQTQLTLSPEKAAKAILHAIDRGSDRVLIGADAVRIDALTRALGPTGSMLFGKMARGEFLRPQKRKPATTQKES